VKIPPTRNHRQLADWINANQLVDRRGRFVCATAEPVTTNTDTKVAGTRFRRIGRGRNGLRLIIWVNGGSRLDPTNRLYEHESSETYRRHSEAREWIEKNLTKHV